MAIPKNIWVEGIPMDPYKKGPGSKVGSAVLPFRENSYKRLVYFGECPGDGVLLGQVFQDGLKPNQ